MINANNSNYIIKQYLFIISFNQDTGINEINFVTSSVTNNIEIMIKIQNYIYDLLNQYSSEDNANKNSIDKLIFLYYQLIIYLFKNYARYENYPKIQKFYSTLSYRFSSIVLKQTVNINQSNLKITSEIQKIYNVKNSLTSKIDVLLTKLNHMVENSEILPPNTSETNFSNNDLSNNDLSNNSIATSIKKTIKTHANNKINGLNSFTENDGLTQHANNKINGLNSFTENNGLIQHNNNSDGLNSFTDNSSSKSNKTENGLTSFTEGGNSNEIIDKHKITNSNGKPINNINELWTDNLKKGGKKSSSDSSSSSSNSDSSESNSDNSDSDSESSTSSSNNSESDSESSNSSSSELVDESGSSYNKMSAVNNAKKIHVKLK